MGAAQTEKKMTYIATFSNGQTIIRNSERTYTFAWVVIEKDGSTYNSGFAADRAKAEKAAMAAISYTTRIFVSPASPRYKDAKERSVKRRAELKTEIVALN